MLFFGKKEAGIRADADSFVSGGGGGGATPPPGAAPCPRGSQGPYGHMGLLRGWVSSETRGPEGPQRHPGYGSKMGMRRGSAALKLEIYWTGFRVGHVDAYGYGYGY